MMPLKTLVLLECEGVTIPVPRLSTSIISRNHIRSRVVIVLAMEGDEVEVEEWHCDYLVFIHIRKKRREKGKRKRKGKEKGIRFLFLLHFHFLSTFTLVLFSFLYNLLPLFFSFFFSFSHLISSTTFFSTSSFASLIDVDSAEDAVNEHAGAQETDGASQ